MAGLYPTEEEYRDYWSGQARRAKARTNAAISPIFVTARDKVTTDTLAVLNDRRYLRIKDPRKRLKKVKNDPKMQQVELVIQRAGELSLQAIYRNLEPHYIEEVPMICKKLYPWTEALDGCDAQPLTKGELFKMRTLPYLGRTYKSWLLGEPKLDGTVQLAQKKWISDFRAIMNGNIRSPTAVSRDVQLVQAIRSILDTNELRNKTVMENAMIQVSRKAQVDVEEAIWQLVSN